MGGDWQIGLARIGTAQRQREHFKPGCTDETAVADDEVAA